MAKNLFLTAGFFIFAGVTSAIFATPVPPGPSVIPVDGSVLLFVAACTGYGVKKIYDARKSKGAAK